VKNSEKALSPINYTEGGTTRVLMPVNPPSRWIITGGLRRNPVKPGKVRGVKLEAGGLVPGAEQLLYRTGGTGIRRGGAWTERRAGAFVRGLSPYTIRRQIPSAEKKVTVTPWFFNF
jgi:hypothetical protein